MIPSEVHGSPVRHYALINPPRFPRGYPVDGNLEPTSAFLISVSDEGSADDERIWVTCLGESGRLMAGDMFYDLDTAKAFPESEFEVTALQWQKFDALS